MALTDKAIQEFKEIYEKKYGKRLSEAEASDAAHNLYGLAELLIEGAKRDCKRELRLKDEPKGFHLDDGTGYTCPICRHSMSYEETWYDKNGMKCVFCQKALDRRIIPLSVLKNEDSWYSMFEFDYYFGIKSASIRKLVRAGQLKARVVAGPGKSPRCEVFLIKDNPDVLLAKPKSYAVHNQDGSFSIEYEKVKLPELLENLRKT